MSGPTEMAQRHGRILAELSELGLALAHKLHDAAMAAEDTETATDLTLAFHRISRCVRQTVALEARLERDRTREAREVRAAAAREDELRLPRRKAAIRAVVARQVWTEFENFREADALISELDDCLEHEARCEGFTTEAIEAVIDRIRAELGLTIPPPQAGEDPSAKSSSPMPAADGAPDPPLMGALPPHPAETAWRSSA